MRPLALAYFAIAGVFVLVGYALVQAAYRQYAQVPYDDELPGRPRYE